MNNIKEIALEIAKAEQEGKKIAMFHFQVLKYADELKHYRAIDFCEDVGVPESYKTEFSKMIKLAEIINERGL